ncbi:DEAD-box ATP-dependent RNA helicase 31 [Camellia lanceoleosa]|uniref:DEAD-box ATP-dependent RNA helicase 31 n=1 Tax=Camellia lanceoleosa TaxID=1840588 RepID=A0ACC0I768_9ERIC|nr:DEAD-box ATP-dependent RNA helicase 31 [Camellia lanceoleosa]
MPVKLLPHLRLLNPSLPVASSLSTMKPNPLKPSSTRLIPIFTRIFPHKIKYQSLSRQLSLPLLTTQKFGLRRFSTRSSEVRASKSLIDDEAELSDWVSGLRSNSSRDGDGDDIGRGSGRGRGGDRRRGRDERGGGRDRASPAKRGRGSDSDDYGMSNRGMGRDSFGSFSRNSSGKARFGTQLEGENGGFGSQRRENGWRGGEDSTIAKRGGRGSEFGYGRGRGSANGGRGLESGYGWERGGGNGGRRGSEFGYGRERGGGNSGRRGSEFGYGRDRGGGNGGRGSDFVYGRDQVGGRGSRGGGGGRGSRGGGLKRGGRSLGRGSFVTSDEEISDGNERGSELAYGRNRGGGRGSDLGYGRDRLSGRGRGGGGGLKRGGKSSVRGGFVTSDEEIGDDDDGGDDDDDEEEEEEEGSKEGLWKSFKDLVSDGDSDEDDGDASDGTLENAGSLFTNKEASPQAVPSSSGRNDSYLSETRFDQCSVSPLSLKGIKDAGYEKLTVVQEATLPLILKGKDVLAKARTGTGKTVAFLLPSIEEIVKSPPIGRDQKRPPILVLVICPTRELASQAAAEANTLLKYHPSIGVQVVIGGTRLPQEQKAFASKSLPAAVPKQRQTLLFSATVPEEVRQICHIALKRDHEFIDTVGEGSEETHSQVRQMHLVSPLDKHFSLLYVLLKEHISNDVDYKVLVFCTTAMVTRLVADLLGELNLNVREIHSRKPQGYRTRVSDEFRKSKGLILVTSDVSARGVDYPDVTLVIQLGLPSDREQYIHRLGRTGRKGKEGQGILLLAPWEEFFLSNIKDLPITKAAVPSVDPETRKKVEKSLSHVEMKNKEAAYQAWLGYYNSNKNVGRDKYKLVELANDFSRSMGLDNPPAIPKLILGKMGLKNIPGLRTK